ncbi:MAG: hypothetical protein ABIK44_08245, partial [candidate division WOR-3 bacterium]
MRGLCLTVLAFLLTAAAFGQGWVGQGRVNRFDSDTDDQPCIALDSAGRPWVVWHGYSADTSRMYSRWLGD